MSVPFYRLLATFLIRELSFFLELWLVASLTYIEGCCSLFTEESLCEQMML